MRLNTSALHDVLFAVSGVDFFVDAGWDLSEMGEMNISRLAMPIERFFLDELDIEPLWLLDDVELEVIDRGGEMLGTKALMADAADEALGLLATEEMLSLLLGGRRRIRSRISCMLGVRVSTVGAGCLAETRADDEEALLDVMCGGCTDS